MSIDLRVSKKPFLEWEGRLESEGIIPSPNPLEQETMRGKAPFAFTMLLLAIVVPTNMAVGWRKTSCPVGDWAEG